jgi:hypothetical protein
MKAGGYPRRGRIVTRSPMSVFTVLFTTPTPGA